MSTGQEHDAGAGRAAKRARTSEEEGQQEERQELAAELQRLAAELHLDHTWHPRTAFVASMLSLRRYVKHANAFLQLCREREGAPPHQPNALFGAART